MHRVMFLVYYTCTHCGLSVHMELEANGFNTCALNTAIHKNILATFYNRGSVLGQDTSESSLVLVKPRKA